MESIHAKVISPGTEHSIAMLSFLMGQQSSLLEVWIWIRQTIIHKQ